MKGCRRQNAQKAALWIVRYSVGNDRLDRFACLHERTTRQVFIPTLAANSHGICEQRIAIYHEVVR